MALNKSQEGYLEFLKGMSVQDLLEQMLEQATGDDWEGSFTPRGYWDYQQTKKELSSRLIALGIITTEI